MQLIRPKHGKYEYSLVKAHSWDYMRKTIWSQLLYKENKSIHEYAFRVMVMMNIHEMALSLKIKERPLELNHDPKIEIVLGLIGA